MLGSANLGPLIFRHHSPYYMTYLWFGITYSYEIWLNYSEMNSIYEMQITGSWWRHYPIQNVILNSEIWWKTQFFDKNDFFHHSSEQISTFIHRNAKLTLGRNMVATGHVTAVAKMNPSYLSGGANVHSFHHLSEQISLSSRIWCEFSRIFPFFSKNNN